MRRPFLDYLATFLVIAEHRSFRRAAIALHVTPSALSHAMRTLEGRLGSRLLNRTTRSVALTEAGARLAERLRPALADVEDAIGALRDQGEAITGRIRLTTMEYGAGLLMDRGLVAFQTHHPGVEVELIVDAALVDLVAAGCDAGVRLRDQVPPDMVVVPIAPPSSLVAAAAPAYLAQRPAPTKPADLLGHRCIRQRLASGAIYRWEFEERGRVLTIDPPGELTINSLPALVAAAVRGAGICYVPAHYVADPIAAGVLVQLLGEYTPAFDGHCLYYPRTRHPTRAFSSLLAHLRTAGP